MKFRIVILASGSGTLTQAVIDAQERGLLDVEIAAVMSDKDSEVLQRAQRHGITTHLMPMKSDRNQWNNELLQAVARCEPDLVVSAGFMRILSPEFVEKFRAINSHPSLLPHFPGAHAVRDALAAGVAQTGCTIHWIDSGVDTGAIIAQIPLPIRSGDTEASLHERIKIAERALIVETIATLSREEKHV